MLRPFRLIASLLRRIWSFINATCRFVANLALLALVVLVIAALIRPEPGVPEGGAALLVRPAGSLVEQSTLAPSWSLLSGEQPKETVLPEMLEAIRAARDDSRIKLLVLETDDLEASGLAKLGELREAIAEFKASGKPVLARGERFEQGQYYLASVANEVHLAPDGFVLLQGLAKFTTYFRGALDKLGIKVHLFRAGEYKSFGEPFTRSNMSEEDREASLALLNGLWGHVREEIRTDRKLTQEEFDQYVLNFLVKLKAAQGDRALAAKDAKLVDVLSTRDAWQEHIKEALGDLSTPSLSFRHISAADYLTAIHRAKPAAPDQIAVLVAQGTIVDGNQTPGVVGSTSFSQLIREAREDSHVKALVIRIDSPGGSAWASEMIRQELELTRKAGKPVVVSMSSVAASGGYWIASESDEIFAAPATLTGSIGVFGMFPEFSEPFGALGLGVDGVATAPQAAALDPRRPLDAETAETLQLDVEHTYRRFLSIVANARKMDTEAVDSIARGRVWSGQEAHERKLVDQIGGLNAALEAAAKRASLQDYSVVWPTQNIPPMRLLLQQLFASDGGDALAPSPAAGFAAKVLADFKSLSSWNDPRHLYTHCLCEMP